MIVVLGSINLDLIARVAHLPRPGETAAGRSFASQPGGKGANQALAARRAGAKVALFGCVGRDAFAMPALALLREGDVAIDGVREVDGATGVALIHRRKARGRNAPSTVRSRRQRLCSPGVDLGSATTLVLASSRPRSTRLSLPARRRHAAAACARS